jgi:hypothetical protein
MIASMEFGVLGGIAAKIAELANRIGLERL